MELNAAKTASNDDARDFSAFKSEIEKATTFLRAELAKLKAGGLDLEAVEGLRVTLGPGKGDAGGKGRVKGQVVRLGDVGQVVPRGRVVVVMVGEKEVSFPLSSLAAFIALGNFFGRCGGFGYVGGN